MDRIGGYMKKLKMFRVEFNTGEYAYVYGTGLSDAYWEAKSYENSTRIIKDIEIFKNDSTT